MRCTIKCCNAPFRSGEGSLAFGRSRLPGRLARALAQLLGLLAERLHLPFDVIRLQFHDVLNIFRPQQLLSKLERARDILFGESDGLFGNVLCALAGGLGLAFKCIDGVMGGGNEAYKAYALRR